MFSSYLESNTRLGVEKKYEFARDSIIKLATDGGIVIEYSKKEKHIYYKINDNEKFNSFLSELNEME